MEATPRGSGAWTMRLTNVTPERFDVPDNSDEAPRLSERAAARARRRLSIVRLSQCVLLADSWGFQPCCRLLGAGVASPWTPPAR
jgi:hypothetical protein